MQSNYYLQNFANDPKEYIPVSYREFYVELDYLEDTCFSEFHEIILSDNHKLYQCTYKRDEKLIGIYEIIEINKKQYYFITILI